MAALDFPATPAVNDVYTANGSSWIWTGVGWDLNPNSSIPQSSVVNLESDLAAKLTTPGAWTSYTPAVGGTGWAVGDGTMAGAWVQLGKTVTFWARFTFGATSTAGAGTLGFTLPANRLNVRSESVPGRILDVSSGESYFVQALGSSATQMMIQFLKLSTVSLKNLTSADTPATLATGDAITINGSYEAA